MKKNKLALYDFDGTIISKDSTKYLFKILSSGKIHFLITYYLQHLIPFFLMILNSNYMILKRSRIKYLKKKIDDINSLDYTVFKKYFNKNLLDSIKFNKKKGIRIVIISAGIYEIIKNIIQDNNVEIIANSLNDNWFEDINGSNKIKFLQKYIRNYEIFEAYGNSRHDFEMLNASKKAWIINKDGILIRFK